MPRLFHLLAVLVPVIAIILVYRTLELDFFDVVATRLSLSWPLAVHPDLEQSQFEPDDDAQLHLNDAQVGDAIPPSHVHVHDPSGSGLHAHHGHIPATPQKYFSRKIVAVGDLHGDLPNAQKVLELAGVVDERGDWTGDVDYFVQTGDIIDRGDDTIKLYFWMDKLRDQARDSGGVVLSHLGNHEWMNVIGDWRYVHPSEIKTFGSAASRQKMLMTGRIGKSWAQNYTTTSRLPLHPSLGPHNTDYDPLSAKKITTSLSHAAISFVHGGLAPHYPDLTPFPSRINDIGYSLLRKLQHRTPPPAPHPPNPYPGLPADSTEAEKMLYGTDGPLWYRGWALEPEDKVCRDVDSVLERTGTRRMIMGHTPDFQRIVSRCNGKIIIIDTGISHAYGGALSALSIEYTLTPTPEKSGAGKVKIWREREVVTALYVDREEVLAEDERDVVGDFD